MQSYCISRSINENVVYKEKETSSDREQTEDEPVEQNRNAVSSGNICYATGEVRLLRHMSKIIENNIRDDKTVGNIDKKLRRQINEKKQAQGLKMG